jgi:hypothetical protein
MKLPAAMSCSLIGLEHQECLKRIRDYYSNQVSNGNLSGDRVNELVNSYRFPLKLGLM